MTKKKPMEEMSYEEAMAELEAMVELLETGERPLAETLEAFKRGQLLFKRCTELLEKAELHVRQLAGDKEEAMEEEE